MFYTILKKESDCYRARHKPAGLSNGDVVFPVRQKLNV
jgi:hypothetical protein